MTRDSRPGWDSLPPEIRSELARSALNRRTVLRGAGLTGLAAALAACGVKGTNATSSSSSSTSSSSVSSSSSASSSSGAPPMSRPSGSFSNTSTPSGSTAPLVPDKSDTDKSMNWSNWPEYIDVDPKNPSKHPTLDAFTAQTGIKVNYTEDVNDNDQYFAKIQPQLSAGRPINADLFVVTDWMVGKLIELGWVQPLNKGNIPNIKNMNANLVNVPFDKGRIYSMTWQSGLTGIAQNPKGTGGKTVDSMDQLLTDKSLAGKVTLLTEMRDTVGLTMLDMGYNTEDFTDDQFNKAIAKLQTAVDAKQIRQFTGNDYGAGLVSGDIAACLAWTGDVVQLKADNPDLNYVLPPAGYTLWSDNMVIPIFTPHKKNAELVMNYYYQPAVAAKVADSVNYIVPVQGVKEILVKDDPSVANNTLIFPTTASLAKAKGFMALDAGQQARYSKAFAKLSGS